MAGRCYSQVAEIHEGAQVKRGDSSAFVRKAEGESAFSGGPAVVLTVNKQPGADTRAVTESIMEALEELKPSLSPGVRIEATYSQKSFIDRAIKNVEEALRDGVILVVIILFLFLMNVRTTFITLTAIPLSLVMTALIFAVFGLSINTMTLGGIAVAMGELVDDAIVDVENIFRRLKENRRPHPTSSTVSRLSSEYGGSSIDRLQHDDRHSRVPASVCTWWHGRQTVCSAGRGIHRIDPGILVGIADRDSGAVLLATGEHQQQGPREGWFCTERREVDWRTCHPFQSSVPVA